MSLDIGLHYEIPMEEYIADPCPEPSISKGVIQRLFEKSPRHAWYEHPRLNPDRPADESTRADIGSAIHSSILGGAEVVYAPEEFMDWRKKGAQEFRKEARAADKIALLGHQEKDVRYTTKAAKDLLATLPGWTEEFETEGTMIWKDSETWKRGRFDIWSPATGYMIDVKTTPSANPTQWIKTTLLNSGYDIQAEHYLDGIEAIGGVKKRPTFLFLLVEFKAPFCASFVGLDPAWEDLARRKIRYGTDLWAKCLKADKWPGYAVSPHWAEPAPWAESHAVDAMDYWEVAK